MAHYAFITDGIVTEVITGIDETETIEGLDTETWYGNFRGHFASVRVTTATSDLIMQALE